MHLIEAATGKRIPCKVVSVLQHDFNFIRTHFIFDWKKESVQYEVFKLITEDSFIHGLISMEIQEEFLYLSLAEAASINKGRNKKYERIAGTLFAFAAQIALDNADGFLYMVSKTKLIRHYRDIYGFVQVGRSQRMISTDSNSRHLVNLYL